MWRKICAEKICVEKNDKYEAWASHILLSFSLVGKASAEFFHLRFCFRIVLRNWKRTEKEFQ